MSTESTMIAGAHQLQLLWRADVYRVLALIFAGPSSLVDKAQSPCSDEDPVVVIRDLAREVLSASEGFAPDDVKWRASLEALVGRCGGDTSEISFSDDYNRLFDTHVLCPPSEGSYHRAERGPVIGDVSAFYEAFQFRPVVACGPADEIKMELAFMSMLCLSEARACSEGNSEGGEVTRAAQASFLKDHLGRWVPRLSCQLGEHALHPIYQWAADALESWVAQDCVRLEVTPVLLPALLPGVEADEVRCAI